MSEHDVLEVLGVLSEAYGVEPASVTGYVWALEEYPHDVLIQAARHAVKVHTWYPKPAEMREIADKLYSKWNSERQSRQVRDWAYYLFDLYREGKITKEQLVSDRATQWVHKQHGIFSALFD